MFIGPCIIVITEESKNQLDATWYFISLLIGSTCFKNYYDYHQKLTTMMMFTTLVATFLVCCMLEVRCSYAGMVSGLQAQVPHWSVILALLYVGGEVQLGWSDVRAAGSNLQPRHHSSLTAPYLQNTANQERHDQCGKQHHSRELLMIGIVKCLKHVEPIRSTIKFQVASSWFFWFFSYRGYCKATKSIRVFFLFSIYLH